MLTLIKYLKALTTILNIILAIISPGPVRRFFHTVRHIFRRKPPKT